MSTVGWRYHFAASVSSHGRFLSSVLIFCLKHVRFHALVCGSPRFSTRRTIAGVLRFFPLICSLVWREAASSISTPVARSFLLVTTSPFLASHCNPWKLRNLCCHSTPPQPQLVSNNPVAVHPSARCESTADHNERTSRHALFRPANSAIYCVPLPGALLRPNNSGKPPGQILVGFVSLEFCVF